MNSARKILRWKAVKKRVPYSRTQAWRKSRDPTDDFPAPVQLGPNAVGWFEDEIDTWLASRPRVNWAGDAADASLAEPEAAVVGLDPGAEAA